ncbi:SixA phosphatase family protein [Marinobacterium jannaschii]|uniref:SixA phosphatase family protein n=1 Tax=Marinobacterium jannaschii TaxID=64970 RepID=UPI000487F245|nr:histidine phosphatase family protein [Marinobacterium jannaschii]
MKKLTLIRHAKSSWSDPCLSDFERPLNKRGNRDLPGLAQRVQRFQLYPDHLLSSGAVRALTTAKAVSDELKLPSQQIEVVPELYESCYETLLNVLQNQPDRHRHIMLVGHNPGLEDLAYYLTHETGLPCPTASVLHIHLSITSWSELAESCGALELYDYPKKHLTDSEAEEV